MISAVDWSVLLDVLCDDLDYAERSLALLRGAVAEGRLLVCETVVAEIRPALNETELRRFLQDWNISLLPSSLETALLAGEHFAAYLERRGGSRRVLPDFLVGAHAQLHADRLLARDRGYYRDYFRGLKVLTP